MSHRPTAALYTLGCKVNQYESEAFAEALETVGFSIVPPTDKADVYIVNTCTVTSESDRKSRQIIRRLIKQNPDAYVIATGCSAETDAHRIAAIHGVDAVIGNSRKMDVVREARRLWESGVKNAAALVDVPPLTGSSFEPMTITRFDRTRAYIKIQDGCESKCAYCAIPAARGPVRSKPACDVISEVDAICTGGCREVVLTGIETGAWGRDLKDGDLGSLLRELDALPSVGRIRLGSLDPTVMTPAFVDSIAPLASTAPHFHLSMQSGSAATLARMRRKYNPRQAEAAMARVRAAIPDVQFTTDIIVGFPGETEGEFAETAAFCRRAEFLHIHVFPYSRRKGTPADEMPDQIPDAVKHERVRIISEISSESAAAILDRTLDTYRQDGKPLVALLETHHKAHMSGHTPNFIEVRVESACNMSGCEVPVYPLRREGEILVCSLHP